MDIWAFIDDVSLGTATADEHLQSVDSALKTFYDAGARLKLSKCQFGVRQAEILGHQIDQNGIKPSHAHVQAIKRLVEPGGGEELMRFLGLMNFFSDFIDHFSENSRPLHEVLVGTGFNKKKKRGQRLQIPDWDRRWGAQQRRAWKDLKGVLGDPDFLAAPKRGASKRLMTDARAYGIGGVLLQRGEDDKWRPIAFTSRKLSGAEKTFTVTERECLAVVHGLRKWRFYLHGEKDVVVVTDHGSLKWVMSLRDPRGKLARWMVGIQDFDFTVRYAPGGDLVVPDTLSRDAVEKPLCARCFRQMDDLGPAGEDTEAVRALLVIGALVVDLRPRTSALSSMTILAI